MFGTAFDLSILFSEYYVLFDFRIVWNVSSTA